MQDLGDPHGPRRATSSPNPTSLRRRRGSGGGGKVALVVLALLLVGGVAWYFLRGDDTAEPPVATAPGTPAPTPPPSLPQAPPLELPELSASDAFLRNVLARLSNHPQFAAWLVPNDLVHRFVGAVVDLAGRSTPAEHVRYLQPTQPFTTQVVDGRTVIAESSYGRFDLLAAVAASIDPAGTAQLFTQLLPLMEEAYAELGIPDISFLETLELAIGNVLSVEVRDGPFEVEAHEGVYVFRDPALEELRGLDRQLMRMGPRNARLIQSSLRAVAEELGLAP